jgi:seryl-tRNA synthetase
MALDDQIKAIEQLSSLGLTIPKLTPDSVIENLIKKDETLGKYLKLIDDSKAEKIERGLSKEEADAQAEEAKKKIVEDLKKSIRPSVEEDITKIKQEYKITKEALESIPQEISTTIATAALPAALPPAVPNPAYTLGIAIQTKKSLVKTLNIIVVSLTAILTIANKLKFELPQSIVNLVNVLGVVTSALSAIPG